MSCQRQQGAQQIGGLGHGLSLNIAPTGVNVVRSSQNARRNVRGQSRIAREEQNVDSVNQVAKIDSFAVSRYQVLESRKTPRTSVETQKFENPFKLSFQQK